MSKLSRPRQKVKPITSLADLDLEDPQGLARKLAYYDNRTSEIDLAWNAEEVMQDLTAGVDLSALWTREELDTLLADLQRQAASPGGEGDVPEPEMDRSEELRQQWGVEVGQVWQLGQHRLLCGDSTDTVCVKRLMNEAIADVCHADPPYGMGKENEGVANDNLYGEKLDAFQMQWWHALRPFLAHNASVYIWGAAEDLWRLWYVGGLSQSERLTFRNEIVWNKGDAGGGGISQQGQNGLRQYPVGSERCLFFMLGEKGFSENADNYWEGWEPIRLYLLEALSTYSILGRSSGKKRHIPIGIGPLRMFLYTVSSLLL